MQGQQPATGEGARIEWHDALDSTNAEAMRRVRAGERGPLWIAARRQLAGRGRNGRGWTSEPGNLYASLLATLEGPPAKAAQLSLLVGVAVHDAVEHLAPRVAVDLKWPNDLLIDGAKLAGILIESQTVPGASSLSVVIGIGLNLAHHPELPDRRSTSLVEHGVTVAPETALASVSQCLGRWLAAWEGGEGESCVRRAWLERAMQRGTPLSVRAGGETLTGWFAGLDDTGALLLEEATGGKRRVTFGDVQIV